MKLKSVDYDPSQGDCHQKERNSIEPFASSVISSEETGPD